ncbi:MAG: hypothetical protein A2Z83_02840 [Omnitrophica bacterium GWA2_52_8]|nr:MAG: hypothetical protein A2Z83_02840 [Omnitrophica bacterium GWA2_52_8]
MLEDDENVPLEEDAPAPLRRRWDLEDSLEKQQKPCPRCGRMIQTDAFSCLFCGNTVFEASGLLGKIVSTLKNPRFFPVPLLVILLAVIAAVVFFMS